MDREDRLLRALPARFVAELCEELAVAACGDGDLPQVTLHLRSGRDLRGVVFAIAHHRGASSLALRTSMHDMSYVPLDSVEALSVHDAAAHAQRLAGRMPLPSFIEPPTRLGARRILAEHRAKAAQTIGHEVEWSAPIDTLADGDPLRALVELSESLLAAIGHATRDEMGKTAIASAVRWVKLTDGPRNLTLDPSRGELVVSSPLSDAAGPKWDSESVRTELEKAF